MAQDYIFYKPQENELNLKDKLEELLKQASYLVLGERLICAKHVHCIRDGFRGLMIYYKDGTYDWVYRLTGVYMHPHKMRYYMI